jgi:hypothetical protein
MIPPGRKVVRGITKHSSSAPDVIYNTAFCEYTTIFCKYTTINYSVTFLQQNGELSGELSRKWL